MTEIKNVIEKGMDFGMAEVIMLASGKGGTGKSTLSVFIGSALCSLEKKVLLIELDAGLRSIDIISGISDQTVYDINDIIIGNCSIEKAIVVSEKHYGLNIISAPYTDGNINGSAVASLVSRVRDSYDYILMDTAAGLGIAFMTAAAVSDRAIVVVTPDPVAVRDGAIIAQELDAQGIYDVRLLLNKVILPKQGVNPIDNLDDCIDEVGVQLIGAVNNSPHIYGCASSGETINDESVEWEIFRRIAKRIIGEYIPLIFEIK